jgi:uncharacterized membrane protein
MLSSKTFFQISGIIFFIVALAHLLRILLSWQASIANWDVPMWLSYIGVIVAGYLAYNALKLAGNAK